jgi:predicted nuclease with RNAse H fold
MFVATAASEILERRRAVVARLRSQGVLVVETSPGSVKADAINEYLEVKARGLV